MAMSKGPDEKVQKKGGVGRAFQDTCWTPGTDVKPKEEHGSWFTTKIRRRNSGGAPASTRRGSFPHVPGAGGLPPIPGAGGVPHRASAGGVPHRASAGADAAAAT